MFKERDLDYWLQKIDYGFLLPALSYFPLPLGDLLSRFRGLVLALMDYEWRSKALKRKYIRKNTYQAMQGLRPESSNFKASYLTISRFVHNSMEEWRAHLFSKQIMDKISQQSQIDCIDELLQNQNKGRGQILISVHLDSFCMGMALMGMRGVFVNGIATSQIEDPRVHPAVRSYFQKKYGSLQPLIQGQVRYHETNMKYFYKVLNKAQLVVIMGDTLDNNSNEYITFLGKSFRLPMGAWRLAKKTNSLVGGYVCLQTGIGHYYIICFPPREIDDRSPKRTLLPIYVFLEEWIRKMPDRWFASDFWPYYGV